MNVLVVTSTLPFTVADDACRIGQVLVSKLLEAGHRADLWYTARPLPGNEWSAYLASFLCNLRRADRGEPVHRLVSLAFPSFALRHPQHACWLLARNTIYYEGWPLFRAGLKPLARPAAQLRRFLVSNFENWFLQRNVGKVFVPSQTMLDKLDKHNGVADAEILRPPPLQILPAVPCANYLLADSQANGRERLLLLLEALSLSRTPLAAKIMVPLGECLAWQTIIDRKNLTARVETVSPTSAQEKSDLLAGCRLLFHAPTDEDFSLLMLEAFARAKTALTTADSGFVAEWLQDNKNGLKCEAEARSIASTLDAIWSDKRKIESLGAAIREAVSALSWTEVLERLLSWEPKR